MAVEDFITTVRSIKESYTGRTKINRLCFLADKCGDPHMELEALRVAYKEIRKRPDSDTQLFKEVVAKIGRRLGPRYGPHDAWVAAMDRWAKFREEKFKNDLDDYKETLNKEKLLKGYNYLGDLYYARGQLEEAFDSYVNSSIYCTAAEQKVDKCILVCMEIGLFGLAGTYASEAEQRQHAMNTITIAKLRCAAGLAYLKDREYRVAALKFVETSSELISESYSELITPRDIAIYGGLCALASFAGPELKIRVTDNRNFQEFLKLIPEIKELINSFCLGDYASCLESLGELKPHLLVDFHLHDHVEDLCVQIRKRALIEYTLPHSSVDLDMMANVFKTSPTDLTKELKLLIQNGQIKDVFPQDKHVYNRVRSLQRASSNR